MNRYFKPLLLGVGGLVVVMLVFSLVLPSQVMTSKWVRVAQEKDSVIKTISDFNTWPAWNLLLNDASQIAVSDTLLTWRSPAGGENKIKLEGVQLNGVSTPIALNGGKFINSGFSIEKRDADSVQIVWFIIEDLKWYPWEKFYGMMAADLKGPLMQESLDRLKGELDKN